MGRAERAAPPPSKNKLREDKREREERKRERKKKEKRGIKGEMNLNQSSQGHVVIGLWQLPDPRQPLDHNGVGISRLASAPLFTKFCLRP